MYVQNVSQVMTLNSDFELNATDRKFGIYNRSIISDIWAIHLFWNVFWYDLSVNFKITFKITIIVQNITKNLIFNTLKCKWKVLANSKIGLSLGLSIRALACVSIVRLFCNSYMFLKFTLTSSIWKLKCVAIMVHW